MSLFKVIAINNWSLVCSLDEDFFSKFLLLFNVAISLITQFSRWIMGFLEDVIFAVLTGSCKIEFSSRFFWPLFITIIIGILLVGSIIIILQKNKNRKSIDNTISDSNMNITVYNSPMFKTSDTAFILCILIVCCIITLLFYYIPTSNTYGRDECFLIYCVLVTFFDYVIFPIVVMARKITFRSYVFNEIKNVCT